jgi:CubicO group peptidase (beta-lactamase class C family)
VLLGIVSACSRPHLARLTPAQAEERLRSIVASRAAPALAAAFVIDGRTSLLSATGTRDLASGAGVTAETVFPWFSVTKLVTATAVMQLAERGLLDLDRPVRTYLPTFAFESPHGGEVTVRHLLSHTAGLANPVPITWIHLASEPGPDLDEMVDRLLAEHGRLEARPGSRYAYSNVGYLVLGQVIERVSGERYPDYVRRHVLDVLGCTSSGFDPPAGADVATGYTRSWSTMGVLGRFVIDGRFLAGSFGGFGALRPFLVDGAPYGGLVGTVPDLARFVAAHLGGGALEGRRILSEASTAAMRTPQRDLRGGALPTGLGWRLGEIDGEPFAYHFGGGAGFKSEVRLYPGLGAGLAVVANETSFDTERVSRILLSDAPVAE